MVPELDEWNSAFYKMFIKFPDKQNRRKKNIYIYRDFLPVILLVMETETVYRFLNKFKNDHFSLAYMGEFDDDLTVSLMRSNETSIHEPQKFKKKLSYLIAECFQNIIRHADKPELLTQTNNKPKIFLLRNVGNAHYISSTNLISNTKKEDLELKLKSINTLTAEKLKSTYMSALINNEISEKGGGGLGLIEMTRKSGYPLEFSFEFVNYFFSIFYFQVRFITGEPEEQKKIDPSAEIHIDQTKAIYNLMLSEKVLFVRKGDFSQESILPLIDLIEVNLKLQSNFSGSKKRTMYLLVELLQNISKHSIPIDGERKGIFMIASKNNNYILTAGNYMNISEVESLKNKLAAIADLDKDELNKMYRNTLLKKEPGTSSNAGIGLIEMCKYSVEKIKYSFKPENETIAFFSLSITV